MRWRPRVQHVGQVEDDTLRLFACSARFRALLTAPGGAALRLGRGVRLATPGQRAALIARDVGCVVPGCPVPGEACEVHHVQPWADGGSTDIENLALVCSRHHAEVHPHGPWQITIIDGIPWVRLPAWMDRRRPLLRNQTHTLDPTTRPPDGRGEEGREAAEM
jgi:5-methylcytosine-specific restriction protein A